MADSAPKKDAAAGPEPPAESELPLDTRLLSDAVIELNISRKNVAIYPPGHIQITNSIDRAFAILNRLLEIRPEMTLGVAKDTLLVGQNYLDKKNPVYRDLALCLSQQGIAALTFSAGLGRDELIRFHGILTTKPETIRSSGGIAVVASASDMPHIRILAIDYARFDVTEEAEITKQRTKPGKEQEPGVWQDFVSLLTQGVLAGPDQQGVPLNEAQKIDPAELARLLNERKLDPSAAVNSYERVISAHVRVAAEKQLTREQSNTLSTFNALLRDLHPDLRKQFLSIAFDRASTNPSPAAAETIIGGFTDDMIIEMLSQANAEGRQISPTLAGLMGKLATAGPAAPAPSASGKPGPGRISAPQVGPEQLQSLLSREKYEEYVSSDYEAMLRQMTQNRISVSVDFPIEPHLASLEDRQLDFQIGRALIAFLEENIEEEDYREFASKLIAIVPGLLDTGNFEILFDISETLRRHASEKPDAGIRAIAAESRNLFSDPEFIRKTLEAFEVWMRDKGQEAAGLIQSLGPDVVPGLMDIYSRDETPGGRRLLFNLLCLFGEPAVEEAHRRLGDPRPYFVRNLLIFIRRAGSAASIPHVKALVQHADLGVRSEALSTLLKFKDPASLRLLAASIRSDDPDVASRAIALAGQYRISMVTEDLLSRIKRVILFETDHGWNADVIKALGEIGDVRAIPDLEKLARAGWSLHREGQLRMKETLYESLARYPRESIAGLLRTGEGLNSDKIRRACRKLADG